jgi:hypothetical protein
MGARGNAASRRTVSMPSRRAVSARARIESKRESGRGASLGLEAGARQREIRISIRALGERVSGGGSVGDRDPGASRKRRQSASTRRAKPASPPNRWAAGADVEPEPLPVHDDDLRRPMAGGVGREAVEIGGDARPDRRDGCRGRAPARGPG